MCNKTGHFARMCWFKDGKKTVKRVDKRDASGDNEATDSDDSDEILKVLS